MTDGKQGKKQGSGKGSIDFPKRSGDLPVAVVPQTGIVPTVKSDTLVGAVLDDPRHEAYAQAVANGSSYAAAHRLAGYAPDTSNAHKLAVVPHVAARIRMLKRAAAERHVCSIASRMMLLDDMVHANPAELTRVVVQPCGECWTDEALAAAMVAYMAARGRGEPVEPTNTDAPRHDCERCAGDGISRVVLTPTAELSAGARALFKSAKQNAKGEIIVETHDRLAAIAELNKMQDGALAATRSMSLSLNAFIPAASDVHDAASALALFDAFGTPGS